MYFQLRWNLFDLQLYPFFNKINRIYNLIKYLFIIHFSFYFNIALWHFQRIIFDKIFQWFASQFHFAFSKPKYTIFVLAIHNVIYNSLHNNIYFSYLFTWNVFLLFQWKPSHFAFFPPYLSFFKFFSMHNDKLFVFLDHIF